MGRDRCVCDHSCGMRKLHLQWSTFPPPSYTFSIPYVCIYLIIVISYLTLQIQIFTEWNIYIYIHIWIRSSIQISIQNIEMNSKLIESINTMCTIFSQQSVDQPFHSCFHSLKVQALLAWAHSPRICPRHFSSSSDNTSPAMQTRTLLMRSLFGYRNKI